MVSAHSGVMEWFSG